MFRYTESKRMPIVVAFIRKMYQNNIVYLIFFIFDVIVLLMYRFEWKNAHKNVLSIIYV